MRIGSVCSGYEGLGLAVQAVLGGELAWVADNDPGAAAILAHRFPSVPNHGDITRTDWNSVEPVDIFTAGFPCTDVSCAGMRMGLRAGTRSGVWSFVAQAIGVLRPPLVYLENVRGLFSAGADSAVEQCSWCLGEGGSEHPLRALGAVLGDLSDLGYVGRYRLVSAADAGAPHRRERVFILAWPAAADAAGVRLSLRGSGHFAGGGGAADAAYGRIPAQYHGIANQGPLDAADPDCAAGGERRLAAPGQAEGGRPRADAGGRDRAPAADTRGTGLEVGAVEPDRDEREAAERGRGDDLVADTGGERRDGRQGFSGTWRQTSLGEQTRGHCSDGSGAPAADADGGRLESIRFTEPAGLESAPWGVPDRRGDSGELHDTPPTAWGPYEPAIRREPPVRDDWSADVVDGRCPIDDCPDKPHAKGLCGKHYKRWKATGDPRGTKKSGPAPVPAAERFWPKVDKNGPIPGYRPELGPCWIWRGAAGDYGYGRFFDGERLVAAHRWSYEQECGSIPDSLHLDHLCRVPLCVRPAHLEAVTRRVNILRGTSPSAVAAANEACPNLHPYTEQSTYITPEGTRACRLCRNEASRRYRGTSDPINWGSYAPAIARWEAVLGRPAPRPTEPGRTGERLSPRFVEFLMGLPEGWVTDVPGLSRNAQLKALGNGVVPAQAELALRLLLDRAGIVTEAGEAA